MKLADKCVEKFVVEASDSPKEIVEILRRAVDRLSVNDLVGSARDIGDPDSISIRSGLLRNKIEFSNRKYFMLRSRICPIKTMPGYPISVGSKIWPFFDSICKLLLPVVDPNSNFDKPRLLYSHEEVCRRIVVGNYALILVSKLDTAVEFLEKIVVKEQFEGELDVEVLNHVNEDLDVDQIVEATLKVAHHKTLETLYVNSINKDTDLIQAAINEEIQRQVVLQLPLIENKLAEQRRQQEVSLQRDSSQPLVFDPASRCSDYSIEDFELTNRNEHDKVELFQGGTEFEEAILNFAHHHTANSFGLKFDSKYKLMAGDPASSEGRNFYRLTNEWIYRERVARKLLHEVKCDHLIPPHFTPRYEAAEFAPKTFWSIEQQIRSLVCSDLNRARGDYDWNKLEMRNEAHVHFQVELLNYYQTYLTFVAQLLIKKQDEFFAQSFLFSTMTSMLIHNGSSPAENISTNLDLSQYCIRLLTYKTSMLPPTIPTDIASAKETVFPAQDPVDRMADEIELVKSQIAKLDQLIEQMPDDDPLKEDIARTARDIRENKVGEIVDDFISQQVGQKQNPDNSRINEIFRSDDS